MLQDSLFNVEQVSRSPRQKGPFAFLLKRGNQLADRPAHGVLRREALGADHRIEIGQQGRIFKDESMGGKDRPVLGAKAGGDVALGLGGFERGRGEGRVQPGNFTFNLFGRHAPLRNAYPFGVEHEAPGQSPRRQRRECRGE